MCIYYPKFVLFKKLPAQICLIIVKSQRTKSGGIWEAIALRKWWRHYSRCPSVGWLFIFFQLFYNNFLCNNPERRACLGIMRGRLGEPVKCPNITVIWYRGGVLYCGPHYAERPEPLVWAVRKIADNCGTIFPRNGRSNSSVFRRKKKHRIL